ncbi:MAG: hypothetical protein V4538_01735 [Bacteroidota bacterium]
MSNTKQIVKWSLITGAFAALIFGVKKGANLVTEITDIEDKFKLFPGTPRIHELINYGLGGVKIAIDSTQIVNQTSLSATLENIYVTVKNQNAQGGWDDLLINKSPISKFLITPNTSNTMSTILLSAGLQDIYTLIKIFKGTLPSQLKIVTRFNYLGLSQTIEKQVDANSFFAPIKAALSKIGVVSF